MAKLYGISLQSKAQSIWGYGLYFSENAAHQNNEYFKYYDHDDGSKGMFYASVNVGDSIDGTSSMRGSMLELANGKTSVKGDENGNTVYVIDRVGLSYPKYYVTFKEKPGNPNAQAAPQNAPNQAKVPFHQWAYLCNSGDKNKYSHT